MILLTDPVAEITNSPTGPTIGAFFDLDGTLLAGYTAIAHAHDRIIRNQASIGEILGIIEASLRYALGRIHFERLLTRAAGYLRGESHAELVELCHQLFIDHLAAKIYPLMKQVITAHQRQGHTVALSSSALSIHAEPVAHALGITHIMCNTFELDEAGLLTGKITTPIVWGHNKAAAVQQFCTTNKICIDQSYFYADGNEDAVLMGIIGNPRPVNPRSGLAAQAAAHNWPTLHVTAAGHGGHTRGAAHPLRHLPTLGSAALTTIASSLASRIRNRYR